MHSSNSQTLPRLVVVADAHSWLYCARGLYKAQDYGLAVQALSFALRGSDASITRDAYHLMGFCLVKLKQPRSAARVFHESVRHGTESDWQMLVELVAGDEELSSEFRAHQRAFYEDDGDDGDEGKDS